MMAAAGTESVCITFRSKIQPGESSFVVPLQRKFVEVKNRRFGFESVTLMPEYQNTQAFAFNLDSKKELEAEMRFPVQLEIVYKNDYYSKDEAGKTWSYLTSQRRIDETLLSINQHFDSHKPSGTYVPPVFIDWFHLEALEEGETIRDFQKKTAESAYGVEFDEAVHQTWLPASLQDMEEMNNCIFPTSDEDADYIDGVRLQLWVGPNTEVTFSNKNLPLQMGFQEAQIPAKNRKGQVPFSNDDPSKYQCFIAWDPPTVALKTAELRGIKMNCYVKKPALVTPIEELVTQKQREREPDKMCEDFAKKLKEMGKRFNVYLDLEYDAASKKFKFVFPPNNSIDVKVYLPTIVLKLLGFDPSFGEFVTQRSVPSPVSVLVDTEDLGKKALALVYDTGMVAVDLDEQSSHLSSHSGTTLMATLHPQEDGTLQNRIYFHEMPRVHVSQTNPNLKFVLYRFDDDNRKSELGWPVGAYIFGTLVGRV